MGVSIPRVSKQTLQPRAGCPPGDLGLGLEFANAFSVISQFNLKELTCKYSLLELPVRPYNGRHIDTIFHPKAVEASCDSKVPSENVELFDSYLFHAEHHHLFGQGESENHFSLPSGLHGWVLVGPGRISAICTRFRVAKLWQ